MSIKQLASVLFVAAEFFCAASGLGQASNRNAKTDSLPPATLLLNDSLAHVYFQRKQKVVETILDRLNSDSAQQSVNFKLYSKRLQQANLFPDSLKVITGRDVDYVGEELRRQRSDVPPILDFGALARSAATLTKKKNRKPRRPRFSNLPVPSPLELRIFNTIWSSGKATGVQIYAKLDSSVNITAEMCWRILHQMAQKGYLTEKLISPQNTFNIVTPIGIFPIEKKKKNRKNREYEYTALFTRNELLQFLESRRFLQQSRSTLTDGKSRSDPGRIDRLIYLLVTLKQQAERKADYN